jgi:hypothetical protein
MSGVSEQNQRQSGLGQRPQIGGGDVEAQHVEPCRTDDQPGCGKQNRTAQPHRATRPATVL